jgi:hypothetical protein
MLGSGTLWDSPTLPSHKVGRLNLAQHEMPGSGR